MITSAPSLTSTKIKTCRIVFAEDTRKPRSITTSIEGNDAVSCRSDASTVKRSNRSALSANNDNNNSQNEDPALTAFLDLFSPNDLINRDVLLRYLRANVSRSPGPSSRDQLVSGIRHLLQALGVEALEGSEGAIDNFATAVVEGNNRRTMLRQLRDQLSACLPEAVGPGNEQLAEGQSVASSITTNTGSTDSRLDGTDFASGASSDGAAGGPGDAESLAYSDSTAASGH